MQVQQIHLKSLPLHVLLCIPAVDQRSFCIRIDIVSILQRPRVDTAIAGIGYNLVLDVFPIGECARMTVEKLLTHSSHRFYKKISVPANNAANIHSRTLVSEKLKTSTALNMNTNE